MLSSAPDNYRHLNVPLDNAERAGNPRYSLSSPLCLPPAVDKIPLLRSGRQLVDQSGAPHLAPPRPARIHFPAPPRPAPPDPRRSNALEVRAKVSQGCVMQAWGPEGPKQTQGDQGHSRGLAPPPLPPPPLALAGATL